MSSYTDHVDSLGETEFYLAMERLKITLSNSQKALLKSKADRDGRINYAEFINFVYDYEFAGGPLEASNSLIMRTVNPPLTTLSNTLKTTKLRLLQEGKPQVHDNTEQLDGSAKAVWS